MEDRMPALVPPVIEPGAMANRDQPVIVVDDDLVLRPWAAADAPFVVEAYSDPDIQHWHFRRYDTVEEAQAWIELEVDGWRNEIAASWAIARRSANEPIGRLALNPVLKDGHTEISYWVIPRARAMGVATRCAIAATAWATRLGCIASHWSTRPAMLVPAAWPSGPDSSAKAFVEVPTSMKMGGTTCICTHTSLLIGPSTPTATRETATCVSDLIHVGHDWWPKVRRRTTPARRDEAQNCRGRMAR
jgi:[ribosomal protein S5]-alanine N-acetyltransferase